MNWLKHDIDITKVQGGKTFCPKCHSTRRNKRDRSLSVDKNTGLFNCHNDGCDFAGTAREDEFLENRQKKDYQRPVAKLQHVGDKMLQWFEHKRGITNNTLLRFNVTESKEWMPGCETGETRSAICFNYYRDEELINIKYRDGAKGFKLEKGAELIFYNLDACKRGKEITIVEGEIDALTLWQCGIDKVVSVPNGASISKNAKLEYLDNCWKDFEHLEKIVIATDNDDAGQALKEELTRRLGVERCWEVSYPEGCKDANEVLLKHGAAAVKEMVQTAKQAPLDGVDTVEDVSHESADLYNNGYPSALRLGWNLDEYIRWRLGEVTVITGIPNAGKSTWLSNVLEKLAGQHGWRTAIFSPEKQPTKFLIAELSEIHIGKPYYRKDPSQKMTPDEWERAMNFLNDHFYFLRVSEIDTTVDGLLTKVLECIKRYGIQAFVLDPWNKVEHKRPAGMNETDYISEALDKISAFAKKYNIHIFIVAHPTKIKKNLKTGQLELPSLYDISGSANFFNKPENGVVIYRNYVKNCTEVHIQKIRWHFVGKFGQVDMYYHVKSQRFMDHMPEPTYEELIEEKKMKMHMQEMAMNTPQPASPYETTPTDLPF